MNTMKKYLLFLILIQSITLHAINSDLLRYNKIVSDNITSTNNYINNRSGYYSEVNSKENVFGAPVFNLIKTQPSNQNIPTWTPIQNLQYNMSVIGKIQLSQGVYSLNENDIIGAFVGTECRGVANPIASLGGVLFLSIGSNTQSGETVSFKVYRATTNDIVNINETISFQNAGEVGTMATPFIFTYVAPCTLTVTPSSQNIPSSPAGSTTFSIISSCAWTAVSNQSWCTVTPSGTGGGTLTANYSINTTTSTRSVNITITVTGQTPVVVTLTQAGSLSPPTWIPISNLQYNMSIIGKFQISQGVYSLNENDIIGAFVGTECRGVASPIASLGGVLFLSIGSNSQSGETVSFKIYRATTNDVVNINETLSFQNAGEVGTMDAPFIFTYTAPCLLSVSPSFQNVPYSPAGSTTFSINSNCAWTAVSNQSWCTVTPSGTGGGTLTANYSINTTNSTRSANITITVAGLTPVVVTLTQAGNLNPPTWIPISNLQFNMSVIGKIQLSQGVYSLNGNDILAAFVGTECRGVANPNASLGGTLFLSIGSNTQSGETVTFKIYKSATSEIVTVNETLSFQNAGEIGTMATPFIFTIYVPPTLSVTPSNQNITFSPAGFTSFSVTSNTAWTVVSDKSWCTVNSSGTGNGTITANYTANTTNSIRVANITVTVAGLTPVVITLTQAAMPLIVVTPTSLAFGNVQTGVITVPQTYSISGSNLISDIIITAPVGFGISTTIEGSYTSTVTLTQTSGIVNNSVIYVKFSPTIIQSYNNNITNSSTGAIMQNVTLTGAGVCIYPSAAEAIIGVASVNQGQGSLIYSIPLIPNATTYVWTLPSGVIGSSSTNTIVVNFSSSAVSDNITVYGHNICGDGPYSSLYISVGNPKTLNITAMLQEYYNSSIGLMNQTQGIDWDSGNLFNNFDSTIVDTLTVLIRETNVNDPNNPCTIDTALYGQNLNVDGTITPISISAELTGYHYIVIIHRNSIETWSDSVDFTQSIISYNFNTNISQFAIDGGMYIDENYLAYIWGGDVNQNGNLESEDATQIYVAAISEDETVNNGYVINDIDGNGNIDSQDYGLAYSNALIGANVINPFSYQK